MERQQECRGDGHLKTGYKGVIVSEDGVFPGSSSFVVDPFVKNNEGQTSDLLSSPPPPPPSVRDWAIKFVLSVS